MLTDLYREMFPRQAYPVHFRGIPWVAFLDAFPSSQGRPGNRSAR